MFNKLTSFWKVLCFSKVFLTSKQDVDWLNEWIQLPEADSGNYPQQLLFIAFADQVKNGNMAQLLCNSRIYNTYVENGNTFEMEYN